MAASKYTQGSSLDFWDLPEYLEDDIVSSMMVVKRNKNSVMQLEMNAVSALLQLTNLNNYNWFIHTFRQPISHLDNFRAKKPFQ